MITLAVIGLSIKFAVVLVMIGTALLALAAKAQNVNITDSVFKAALVNNFDINTNSDTAIQVSEANSFTGAIDVFNPSDLTGIEHFTNLNALSCYGGDVSSLDLSQNSKLEFITLSNTKIDSIDFTNNTMLMSVYAIYNDSLAYVNVSKNKVLSFLNLRFNSIDALDVSGCTSLTYLDCGANNMTSLDVRNGNNYYISTFSSEANDLECISVDNESWSYDNWQTIDMWASFSSNCTVGINDVDIEQDREVKAIYDISGRQVYEMNPNTLYIIKYTDGHTEKQMNVN